ncbi:MAG: hypothetical protein IPO07_02535 [Haliscomenobacter sp.]|nr:hypothetical protein [Haliscomenobacter sp.]MBK9487780.1 hypothetical protein [Haliscomenobacter sp.]
MDLVNDNSVTCCFEFSAETETFLGLQQRLTVSKCFQLLDTIAVANNANDKRIRAIYDDLLYRFSNENSSVYNTDVANFKQNGRLLSNKDIFQKRNKFILSRPNCKLFALDESDKVLKRFGDKDYWKKFEVVLNLLGKQKLLYLILV